MQLDVNVTERDGRTVVGVAGEIDAYTAPTLDASLQDVLGDNGVRVIVDLTEVGFLDSTGLGTLVAALNRARAQDGSLALVVNTHRVRRIFELSSLTELFPLHETLDEAMAASA